ncbi:MAG: DUF3007 family protein [Cyanobium sp.]
MTRGQVLLLGLALLGGGLGGLAVFQASGFEGFSAGIAASVLLLLVIVGWTATYLLRVVSGTMTFSEQRRRYRAGYEAATDAALAERFASLPAAEQERLLAEIAAGEPGLPAPAPASGSASSDTP